MAEQLYKLAGETITTKINKNREQQKKILEQRMALNEQILESKTKEQMEQKSQLKQKIEELEKINAKLQAGETANASRVNQFKSEYDKLHEKYKLIQVELDEKIIETQKMQR